MVIQLARDSSNLIIKLHVLGEFFSICEIKNCLHQGPPYSFQKRVNNYTSLAHY